MREFNPVGSMQLMPPAALLMLPAENDGLLPFNAVKAAFDQATDPKAMMPMPIGHYGVYEDPWRSKALEVAADWYREHL